MCLRNVPVLLNVLLNASLGQSCSTNHACDIECWTECPACNVQQKCQAEILFVHQDKEKENTEALFTMFETKIPYGCA
jgi:hypothetical protein